MALEFHCSDVGVACSNVAKADSEDALVEKVAAHAKKAHGVELTQTLKDYARAKARTSDR